MIIIIKIIEIDSHLQKKNENNSHYQISSKNVLLKKMRMIIIINIIANDSHYHLFENDSHYQKTIVHLYQIFQKKTLKPETPYNRTLARTSP